MQIPYIFFLLVFSSGNRKSIHSGTMVSHVASECVPFSIILLYTLPPLAVKALDSSNNVLIIFISVFLFLISLDPKDLYNLVLECNVQ